MWSGDRSWILLRIQRSKTSNILNFPVFHAGEVSPNAGPSIDLPTKGFLSATRRRSRKNTAGCTSCLRVASRNVDTIETLIFLGHLQ